MGAVAAAATARVVRVGTLVAAVVLTATATVAAPSLADNPAPPLYDLLDAAVQRLQTADPVAANKWATGTAIEDPQRVQQVLAAVTADAQVNHIDPNYVRKVFTDQIHATEAIEYTRFAQWKLDPAAAPATAPDLSSSRSSIDALNSRMVSEMTNHWDLFHSPACGDDVTQASNAVISARQLDTVYQQALAFATHSYCG